MLRKAIISLGLCFTLFLVWFSIHSYQEAVPIAEENLRGLALSVAAAIDNLAIQDPSLEKLSKYHTPDIAYFALIDRHRVYRFHSNQDLIGTSVDDKGFDLRAAQTTPSEARVTLGTGERAFQFTTPLFLPGETLVLRLTLHTYRADAVVRRAKANTTILLGLLVAGWILIAVLIRYARREELHQMELARKESLAKLGEMGAMLAHEIRNPLSGIKGFAQVIAKKPAEARNGPFAEKIVTEAVRLENLVTDLLAYASSSASPQTPFDVAALIDDTLALLAPEASHLDVRVAKSCQDSLTVSANRDRLEQAFLNVGKNALHAMPEGGTLEVTACAAGGKAVITLKDSGHGISAVDLQKVFDPFFTTKARGTGLGLALCKKIVEEHGGSIALASALEDGTTVTITLPLNGRDAIRRSLP